MQFYAICPKGVESLLADELTSYGAKEIKEHPTHVTFEGELAVAYRACLHSRLANRIYLCLLDEQFDSVEELYKKVNRIEWSWHFDINQTFAVTCVARKNKHIRHSGFGGQKVKDAIVDYYQERYEQRPSVDKESPDYRVHALINGTQLKIGIDLCGHGLNQRGYRADGGRAPIKENLAAALLLRAGWPELAREGYDFHDPMCGSGTLLIEAAMMASDMAPGLLNHQFDFQHWKQHDDEVWREILARAKVQAEKGRQNLSNHFYGSDSFRKSLPVAKENCEASGLAEFISIEEQDIRNPSQKLISEKGLLLSNPPYAERLGEEDEVTELYRDFGDYIKARCMGWKVAFITTDDRFAKAVGIRSHKQYKFKNGALDCKLYLFDVNKDNYYTPFDPTTFNPNWENNLSDGANMLKNRIRKNMQRLKSYLKQNNVHCYRLYDADLPEYSAAIDVYEDEAHIQEYMPPKEVPEKVSNKRLNEIVRVTAGILELPEAEVHLKQRKRQKGKQQYTKQSQEDDFKIVEENGFKFQVNLKQYLDTGLFLDHRKTRKMIYQEADGKKFLNLFAYTGSVSVYAALGGAKTTTVDMSNTYLNWAKKNFSLNSIAPYGHNFIQADCVQWLEEQEAKPNYDLIFLDPPTFSNSKRMEQTFDVQRDQESLIDLTMGLLKPEGKLYFSNNFKKFSLEPKLKERYIIHEITGKTLPPDFKNSRNHHRCWLVQHKI
ncbi:bifunctional 23S rRNA (guanine(2069)-N(7))-methyltransferase RlmK/23S rRNA (guanine(2445)-N(2))-methyltransferase RlmL [Kangiella sediminilitoris]|uniref:Ribosomal RNA large subunit methyltransferase K/L n=1 Tax=Kangiella sediminilitoris TaxID=1144748 RepID=A0A1B3B9D1_9GAMM|nr:bifunctional 23S rRNA (guanine(2069)-N(7))-methyltransferase RlmK/23S rRNA (guanine(2445)-N(2))-methyltransferase RlmL [Kangiella sediminilitoris]AOE49401.1 Ribosomal RNA large subunit methyltransferase K/L [Kangiella sediminilitoris]